LTDGSLHSADKDLQESHAVTEKPRSAQCCCKIQYVSKFTSGISRSSLYNSVY